MRQNGHIEDRAEQQESIAFSVRVIYFGISLIKLENRIITIEIIGFIEHTVDNECMILDCHLHGRDIIEIAVNDVRINKIKLPHR